MGGQEFFNQNMREGQHFLLEKKPKFPSPPPPPRKNVPSLIEGCLLLTHRGQLVVDLFHCLSIKYCMMLLLSYFLKQRATVNYLFPVMKSVLLFNVYSSDCVSSTDCQFNRLPVQQIASSTYCQFNRLPVQQIASSTYCRPTELF